MFRKEEKKGGGEFCAKPPSDGLIVSCVLQLNLFHFVCTTIQIYEKKYIHYQIQSINKHFQGIHSWLNLSKT